MFDVKLSKRLLTVANYVDGDSITDVGCDHGLLTAYLFDNNKISYAIVSDISKASLSKAVSLLSNMNANFDYAVCDGISKDANVDVAVICGMGGNEIINILTNNKTDISNFVLGPQHNEVDLKKYLIKHNYHIIKDVFVCDGGKFYNIIKCNKSTKKCYISKQQLYLGMDLPESDYNAYVDYLGAQINNLINIIPKSKSCKLRRKLRLVKIAQKRRNVNERNS